MSETADQLTQKTLSITILFLAVFGLILFTPAGSFDYWQAWAYWAVFSAAVLFITLYFFLTDPKLIENRLRGGPTAEKERSQKIIQAFSSIFFILLILLPGIDHRFGWSEVPVPLVLTGDIFIALGFFIVFLTFRENRYASSIIIVDAGQRVIASGPYEIVRHPMYAGAILVILFTPIALGSVLTLPVVVPLCAGIVWRLLDEEKFLSVHLTGYDEYCLKTRYHLIPNIW